MLYGQDTVRSVAQSWAKRPDSPDIIRSAVPGRKTRNVFRIVREIPLPCCTEGGALRSTALPLLRIDPTERVRPPAPIDR
jgi:hypothetical protein